MSAPMSGPRHLSVDLPTPILSNIDNKVMLEVYSQQIVARAEGLVADATAMVISDSESFLRAQKVLIAIHDVSGMVEGRRTELKKPINQIGKSIDEIAHKLADPLADAKRGLQTKIMAHQRAEEAKADALRREAEAKARVEREAQDAERRRLEAEAQAKADEEARAAAEILGVAVEATPEPVVIPVAAAKPMEVPAIPTTPKASAVSTRKVKRLVIDDASKIPYRIGEIVLMVADTQAIKHALTMGLPVAGCRLVEDEQVVMAGSRA